MQFNSISFLIFLPLVVVIYYQLDLRARRALLLLASFVFYGVWSVPFLGLLVLSTLLNYGAARLIGAAPPGTRRKAVLWIGVAANLGVLCLFKYADFLSTSFYALLGVQLWPELRLILPLGISFYTFRGLSYVIDVYRGTVPAERSLTSVVLHISFFPQLVAGPIARAGAMIPQLAEEQPLDWDSIRRGSALVIYGLAKKVLVADALANAASEAFRSPEQFSGSSLLLATYAYTGQIYCDFSAYSDIAIGATLLLGMKVPANFNKPYLSCSIREFWQRWHISLSTWLRDYLYIPLGGSRQGATRTCVNLMITMLLGGLWHGAGWGWVAWGGMQGAAMCVERTLGIKVGPPERLHWRLLAWVLTFHFICLSWIVFGARDLAGAVLMVERIASLAPGQMSVSFAPVAYLLLIITADLLSVKERWLDLLAARPAAARWVVYASVAGFALLMAGVSSPEFIYFQF